jgi:RNA polymerase sigma-70 factor, ECF subfamily
MVLPTDDLHLLHAAQRGDLFAFQALVERYQTPIYRVALRLLGNVGDAEDATQETFLAAWRALLGFRAESTVSTWLYRIVTNRCLNTIRARPAQQAQPYSDEMASFAHSPEQAAEQAEQLVAVKRAILELTAEQRTALVLREVEGLSYDQIAEVLETTVPAIKGRVHRARLELVERAKS